MKLDSRLLRKNKWFVGYWTIVTLLLLLVLISSWEANPNMTLAQDIMSSVIPAVIFSVIWVVVFCIPYVLINKIAKVVKKRRVHKKALASSAGKKLSKRDPDSLTAISSLMNSSKKKPNHVRTIIFLGLFIALAANYQYVGDYYSATVGGFNAEENIRDLANNSGFSISGKAAFYRSNPQLVDANTLNDNCPHAETVLEYGCYISASNQLFILDVSDSSLKEIEYASAAHETLHAIWTKLDMQQREKIAGYIQSYIDDSSNQGSKDLQGLLAPYSTEKSVRLNEAHSFVGAQIKTEYINDSLLSYYGKYFENRSVPVYSYSNFNASFDRKKSDLETERQNLEAKLSSLQAYKKKNVDPGAYYVRNSCYYGPISSCNQNTSAYTNNINTYNKLVDEYNASRDTFNANVDKYNAILQIFYPSRPAIKQDNGSI